PERSLSHNPLFQVMFTLQNAPRESLELSGLQLNSMKLDDGVEKFDLTLAMVESGGELAGVFSYSTDLFEAATIERMCRHYLNLLEEILVHPQCRVMELPFMSRQERQEIIVEWNQTATDYPRDRCVPELFEQQVELTPEAVAVVYEGEQVTYR